MKEVIIDGIRYVPEPDPLAEVKAAWKGGKTIQYFASWLDEWRDIDPYTDGSFLDVRCQWRVKPEKKPDVVQYVHLHPKSFCGWSGEQLPRSNAKLTFDDTGKLIKAEVL